MPVEAELRTYLQVLWRHKWMIAASATIAPLVALVISLQLTPIYAAKATLRVASAPGGAVDYVAMSSLTRLSNTYVQIATSDIILDEVAKRLGMQKQPIVEVEVVPETELIDITASDPDPARARDIANTLAGMMVEQSTQLYGGSAPTAREILESQLDQAKADLDIAMAEYDNALRGVQSTPVASESGTQIPNATVDTLAHLISVRQQIYTDLLQKYETARTNEQLRANAITVFQPAYLPQKPAQPKVLLNTALGLVAGLAMGVILAFLFEGMDDTLRDVEEVQDLTTLPIFCAVPVLKRAPGLDARLRFSRNGHLSPEPAFQHLRARLLLSDTKPKPTSFLITSPEPGAGKSVVSANLAISLAEAGQQVVLLDMDFYRPRLHSIFNLPHEKGISNWMCGDVPLDAALQATPYQNLRVATAGSNLDGASTWLTAARIGELLERLGQESDYVLIDAPALLSVADPAVIASQTDAVILVVAQRGTGRKQLRFALQQLTELTVRVAGIVVNKVPGSRLYSYYSRRPEKAKSKPVGETHTSSVARSSSGAPQAAAIDPQGAHPGSKVA